MAFEICSIPRLLLAADADLIHQSFHFDGAFRDRPDGDGHLIERFPSSILTWIAICGAGKPAGWIS